MPSNSKVDLLIIIIVVCFKIGINYRMWPPRLFLKIFTGLYTLKFILGKIVFLVLLVVFNFRFWSPFKIIHTFCHLFLFNHAILVFKSKFKALIVIKECWLPRITFWLNDDGHMSCSDWWMSTLWTMKCIVIVIGQSEHDT